MKWLFTLSMLFGFFTATAQLTNGSFETVSGPDLSGWEWTCGATSFPDAPPQGGSWCIRVSSGNTQGCFPGYAYQKLPSISDGEQYTITGWAYRDVSFTPVGIYFGTINKGVITLHDGDTTSAVVWANLAVQSRFDLLTGDTAVVVLYAGLTGGPVQGYAFFDKIALQKVPGTGSLPQAQALQVFPNPFTQQAFITGFPYEATLTVFNMLGQPLREMKKNVAEDVMLSRDGLPCGTYFFLLREASGIVASGRFSIAD